MGESYDPPALTGIPLFKGDEGLLRPDGHLLWERRLAGERCSPIRWVVYRLEKGKDCGKGCAWVGYLFGKGGAM